MATIGQALPQPEVGWKRYDDRSSLINYVGSWTLEAVEVYYNSTVTNSIKIDDYLEFAFLGTDIRIIDATATNRSADVVISIDGVEESYSGYSTTTIRGALLYEKTGLPNTVHKVRITNKASGYIALDAIDINEDGEIYRYDYLDNRDIPELMRRYGLHWFGFDEESGNVIDKVGNTIGTVYANASRVKGWNSLDKAIKFNRTSTSYVNFDSRVIPTNSYTLRFKLRMFTKPSVENQELFSNAFSTSNHIGLRIWVNVDGVMVFTSTRQTNNAYDFTVSSMGDFDGTWHDYILSWDANAKIVTVYKDGKVLGRDISVTTNATISTYNLRIGRQASSAEQRYADCEMDDIQVYGKALTLDDFEKKYLTVKSTDDKTYVLSPEGNRLKEVISNEDVDIVNQGHLWNEINSATTSEGIDMNKTITEYEIVGKDNSSLGYNKVFTLPISNFKTVKIEDNY